MWPKSPGKVPVNQSHPLSFCFLAEGMGVKGLQYFMDCCCPDVCVTVNLREMATQHATRRTTTDNGEGRVMVEA